MTAYRHVQIIKDPATGKARFFYFRKPGCARVMLPGPYGSPAFAEAYKAAFAGAPVAAIGSARVASNSIAALVTSFKGTQEYRALKPASKVKYGPMLERLRIAYGDGPVAGLNRGHAIKLVEQLAGTASAQRVFHRLLRRLFDRAVLLAWRDDNPFGFKLPRGKRSEGHPTWTEEHCRAFESRWAIGTMERLAFTILVETGARRGDAVRLAPANLKVEPGKLVYEQEKIAGQSHARVNAPVRPILAAVLAAGIAGAANVVALDTRPFLVNRRGRTFTADGFTEWFGKAVAAAGLPRQKPGGLTPHGLRKTFVCRRRRERWSTAEIMAYTGHGTAAEIDRYGRQYDRVATAEAAHARTGT